MIETYLKLNVAKTYDKYRSLPGSHVRLFTMLSDYVFEVYWLEYPVLDNCKYETHCICS